MSEIEVRFDTDNPEWTDEDFARAIGPSELSAAERSAFPNTVADDDSDLHVLNLDKPRSVEIRKAYLQLLLAGERAGYRTRAGTRGPKRGLHFMRRGQSPYSLIVNVNDILFYLRKPSLVSHPSLAAQAKALFDEVRDTDAGEVTIRLRSGSDARQLSSWLFAPH